MSDHWENEVMKSKMRGDWFADQGVSNRSNFLLDILAILALVVFKLVRGLFSKR